MADLSSLLANAGQTNADFDLGKLNKSYWEGRDQFAKNDLRDAFKGGVPVDANGQPDFAAMAKVFFEKGDPGTGLATTKTDLERQKLKAGLEMAARDFPSGAASPAPTAPPIVGPPSTSRTVPVSAAPPLTKGAAVASPGGPQGDQPGSIVGIVSGLGIPDELAGPIIAQVSAATRMDPNAAVPPQHSARVAQIAQEAVKRSGGQPAAAAPAPAPAPAPASTFKDDPTLGGLVPAGRTPAQQIQLLSRSVASGLLAPEVAKVYETNIKAIQDAIQPTPEMKNARATGKTLEEYQARTDEETTRREVLTKSLIPKLEKSQESASAARDDIDSIHRAREELDKDKGIFAGSFADKKLQFTKIASMLGITNSDKIANTEAYQAAVGQRVAAMVKAFGSGTAISDGDRRFAQEMAGGRITLDEKSMRRILDIGERAARGKITNHNVLVDNTIAANEGLKPAKDAYVINAPGAYKAPEVAAGGNASVASRADYDRLPKGAVFTGPDGKRWRKP